MDMGSFEVECEIVPAQKVKESDRVRTAREGRQNPLSDQLREGGEEVLGKSREGHAPSYPIPAGILPENPGRNWWRWVDLNHRHRAYETPALPLSYTAQPSTIAADSGCVYIPELSAVSRQQSTPPPAFEWPTADS